MKYPTVIFKPADKNLGLVALNFQHYNDLVHKHLNDITTYMLICHDEIQTQALLDSLHTKYSDFTTDYYWYPEEQTYLTHFIKFQFPYFYVTPKIHKTGPLTGRPISGAVNWITTPISTILNIRLKPHLIQYNTILKNSYDLVKNLEDINTLNLHDSTFYLITADVESLYPNIDIPTLLKIVDNHDELLTPLTEFVCQNSYVRYGDKVYHQRSGIAMGTNAAVTLANLYLAKLLDPLIMAWHKLENGTSTGKIFYYQRFIDDLFIVWQGSLQSYQSFRKWLSHKLPQNIRLTFTDPATQNVAFLDLNITFDNYTKKFHTSIYQKALNRYTYITPYSQHVRHVFTGFIKGELTRYSRLCTDPYSYEIIKGLFKQRLLNRGYLYKDIINIFIKHQWNTRYKEANTNTSRLLPFVIPYTNRTNIKSLETYFRKIESKMTPFIEFSSIKLVYGRSRNIHDLVCHSRLTEAQTIIANATNTNNNKPQI